MRPAKARISLGGWASAQSDQSLRCARNGKLRTQRFIMRTANTDQTRRMPRLIRDYVGRSGDLVGFVMSRLKCRLKETIGTDVTL